MGGKCIVCHEREAVLPDRYATSRRKRICRECHAARLRGDLAYILKVEADRRRENEPAPGDSGTEGRSEEMDACQEKCSCGRTCERIDAHTDHECPKCNEEIKRVAIDLREIDRCIECDEKWGICGYHQERFGVNWQGLDAEPTKRERGPGAGEGKR